MAHAKAVCAILAILTILYNQSIVAADHLPPQSKATDDLARWDNVSRLRKGKRIEITSKDGRMVRGKLQESSQESVTIRNEITRQINTWRRNDIRQIKEPRMETPKPLSVGLAIGLALGAGIGAALAGGSDASKAAIPISAGMGAVGGALLGDAYSKHHKGKVIYLAGP
jgi:hypothetical protein